MLFLSKNNAVAQTKSLSFKDWITHNNTTITSNLLDNGLAFVTEHAEKLKAPLRTLLLDDRWHYLDKPKKESYRASLSTDAQGVPHLKLTYYSFRQGGVSIPFDSKPAIKSLWKQALDGRTPIPRLTPPPVSTAILSAPVIAIDYLAKDLAHWNTLSQNGISHYLNRKGLGGESIPGLRFSSSHVCVQIINTTGAYQGLQTIYNDGQKRFTKGLAKKGHFALIGLDVLPEKLTTLHICEGVATASSLFLALNEPVFAALDAFNLLAVARALKARFPKTQIILWADNDWQKAAKVLSNGRPLGNTGLIQANLAAFKLRDALVCTPDLSLLPLLPKVPSLHFLNLFANTFVDVPSLCLMALQSLTVLECLLLASNAFDTNSQAALNALVTDFNDMHHTLGISCITNALPQKPDMALALTHALYKFQQQIFGALSIKQFDQASRTTYDSRYLPELLLNEGVHLIKSPIGTGKTAVVEALVKANPAKSVLFTTHLISLVESAAARLDLCSYNDCDTYDLHIESRLAICLNSLGKLTAITALRNYDIVIIDEIEQVLARLTTHIDQKPLVFSVLMHIMTHAKTLICLDAHLSKATVQMIQATCWDKPITVHINHYENDISREIIFHDNAESVQLEAMRTLAADKTVFLTFNSKADAFKTFSAINALFPEKKGLYIASDNAGDAANQAFFKDVNGVSKLYDYLICTPSVSTGVSIDNGHFDFVGGIFLANVNTANDCMQALGRVRDMDVRHVFCEKRFSFLPLDADTIAARWTQTHQHDLSLMGLTNEGARVVMNADYEALCLLVTLARNRSFNDFYQQFALLSLDEGIKLSYAEFSLDIDTKKQFKQLKQSFIQVEAGAVGQAIVPETLAAIRELLNMPRKSMEQTRSMQKQQAIDFYRLSPDDTESIQALTAIDNDNRFKKSILTLELALGDGAAAKKQFLSQTENYPQFAPDVTHFATLQMLFKRLLDALHLSSDTSVLNTSDYHYTKTMFL